MNHSTVNTMLQIGKMAANPEMPTCQNPAGGYTPIKPDLYKGCEFNTEIDNW